MSSDRDLWLDLLRDQASEEGSPARRIAEGCVKLLGVTGAGISMVSNTGNRRVLWATDDVSSRIEELQVTLGEGPCIDACSGGGPVLVRDLDNRGDLAAERWPTFMPAAQDAGVRAVFAFPLQIGAIAIGAIDLYRTTPGGLSEAELSGALIAAEVGGLALLRLGTDEELALVEDEASGMRFAQVHQATGMVMVQLGVPAHHAFALLRARAFAAGRPLRDVAIDVVERRLRFTQEDL